MAWNTDKSREGAKSFLLGHGVPEGEAEGMLAETDNTFRTVAASNGVAVALDIEPPDAGYTAVSPEAEA